MSINETITVKSTDAGKEARDLHDDQDQVDQYQTIDPEAADTNMTKSEQKDRQNRKQNVIDEEKKVQQSLKDDH